MFYSGQRVECVDVQPGAIGDWKPEEAPRLRGHYTVLETFYFRNVLCVHLRELARCPLSQALWGPEVGYAAFRFRAILDHQTDITSLEQLLNAPEPKRIRQQPAQVGHICFA